MAEQQKKIQLTPELANNLFQNERQKYDAIVNERKRIERILLDTEKTINSIKEIKDSKEDSIFVNLGSGVFVSAKIEKNAQMMVGDVFLPKKFEEILENLEKRKQSLTNDLKELQKLEVQSQNNLNQLYNYLMQNQQKK